MNILAYIFVALTLYGAYTGMLGAALLSFGMIWVVLYAKRHYTKQDAMWAADPANAKQPTPTRDVLLASECECMRDVL